MIPNLSTLSLQGEAFEAYCNPQYLEQKRDELLATLPEGTIVSSEVLRVYPHKTDLHSWFLSQTLSNRVNIIWNFGEFKAFATDALMLYLLGFPVTVEDNVLTVTIPAKEVDFLLTPRRVSKGWASVKAPDSTLRVTVRYYS